ncbi:MAG TPA: PEP/pyruvate-binding domain-containing protein [Candidatus Cloacimonadota bacterium]|nr:PEP/pyruvate-binding domain-containing protein [Candidatus Cloacimonadota bacterium]
MDITELNHYYNKFKFGEDIFYQLMQHRVRDILLVSTFYDAYIFEQDGQLSELIFGDYKQLNLTTAPRINSVPTAKEAITALEERKYDLVITMMRIGEMTPFQLARYVKDNYRNIPVLLLLNNKADFALIEQYKEEMRFIDNTFLWSADTKLFLAMVKNIEDQMNVKEDTHKGLVRVILLVEDSINYYSLYLPILYGVVMRQTQRLIEEELNDLDRRLRMRIRPKVILAKNYEDALKNYETYKEYLLCVISDVRYQREGIEDPHAGFKLVKHIRSEMPDIPVILQSAEDENQLIAENMNITYLNKNSKQLLLELRQFFINHLGFGNFAFKDKNMKVITEATSLADFQTKIDIIPDDSILYHSKSNHFSNWLIAHGEINIARKIRKLTIADFPDTASLRAYIKDVFGNVRKQKYRGKIINFESRNLNELNQIVRLAEGSLGGKGRGLAFLNALLTSMELEKKYGGVNLSLPSTAIIGTNEFDQFIEDNKINERIQGISDQEIDQIFIQGDLSQTLKEKLKIYLEEVAYPIAVRSSSLLEDSQLQPFAGVYRTFMLPNNHPAIDVRLDQIMTAIKLVFASVYLKETRSYIEGLSYKIEEEKMAVIIQEVVGQNQGDSYFYPHISGVAQSYNFYPTSYMAHEDGISNVALGLGKAVVEGKFNYRFCPKFPANELVPQDELIRNSQKEFYAIDLNQSDFDLAKGEEATLIKLDLKTADKHGTLTHLASVWDYENNMLVDDLFLKGVRVLTFSGILKYDQFPLAKMLVDLLQIGEVSLGIPVEIEFAVDLGNKHNRNQNPTFYILQIRPLSVNPVSYFIDADMIDKKNLVLFSKQSMGNGVIEDVFDIVYVDPEKFDKVRTEEIQQEIDYFNQRLKNQNRPYILLGPGRWGSRDRFLGIPVKWSNISYAKTIVEYALPDFIIENSQGTHFFHNLVAMNIGYFNIPVQTASQESFIDWEWLKNQTPVERKEFCVHCHFSKSLLIRMDGKHGIALIEK